MINDIVLGGVLIPGLLALALVAAILTVVSMRLLSLLRIQRDLAAKPLIEISLFIILLSLLVYFLPTMGLLQ